jgi:hypothetical protein
VSSTAVAGGRRTVVLTRPLKGATPDHYTFAATDLSLGFISAVGTGPQFGYHKASSAATLALWPAGAAPACVCAVPAVPFGKGSGMLKYLPTGQTIGFPVRRSRDATSRYIFFLKARLSTKWQCDLLGNPVAL